MADAAGVDRSSWSGAARSDVLLELLAARERLDALVVAVAGDWDREQAWAVDGGVSPVSWLAHRAQLTRQDASTLVRTARHVIDLTIDADTLAGRPPSDLAKSCCKIKGHGPISPALGRTLACDAAIGRVVMRGDTEVLDVGRRTRLVTAALRRSLDVRGRGCVEPGCAAPSAWCDAHHIVRWTAHGPTALHNLELRCRRHHILQHQRDHHTRTHRRE